MEKRIVFGCIVGALMYSVSVGAATLIEFTDSDGEAVKMWIEGTKMRMDTEEGYALTDWDARTMYFVNMEEGMVMDLSAFLSMQPTSGKGAKPTKAVVEKVGNGPEIVGYSTVHYRISVDGDHCQDIFASAKAMRDLESKDLIERMQSMANSSMDEMDDEWSAACDHADQGVDFTELGFPMRTVDIESGLVDEVTAIELDAGSPEGGFGLPQGMQIMDLGQMMMPHMPGEQPE